MSLLINLLSYINMYNYFSKIQLLSKIKSQRKQTRTFFISIKLINLMSLVGILVFERYETGE